MIIKNSGIKTCDGSDAELIIPPHPELDEFPGWLKERALARYPDLRDAFPASDTHAVNQWLRAVGEHDWLDHWGTVLYDGDEYLASEPYDLNKEKVQQLVRFCEALQLKFSIQAAGHHYPTQTMRILVWPSEWSHTDELLFEGEGYQVKPEYLAQSAWAQECKARALETLRALALNSGMETSEGGAGAGIEFALESHLRDYLAKNPSSLEEGMTLWPVSGGGSAVEFAVGDGGRVDILARDRAGLPVVVETKVSRGHEKTIGQVARYKAGLRRLLNVERVRILVVTSKASHQLRLAASELPDCDVIEYRLNVSLRRQE